MDGQAAAERDENDGAACVETTKDGRNEGRKERTNERRPDERAARRDEARAMMMCVRRVSYYVDAPRA
eukprot:10431-Pelagococcus_subviridis.AAC.1